MDSPEEAALYDRMDHAEVNRQFVDDLLATGPVGVGNESPQVLDLGTGPARIPLELCRRLETVRVVGVDLSSGMLDVARINIELGGVAERIRLERVDAKQLPYANGAFDLVMSNSIVHHLPDPERAWAEAIRITRPGGRLFFRDLARPETREQLESLVNAHVRREVPAARKMFAESLHAALHLSEVRELVRTFGFDPGTVQMTSDRHWTWDARKT